jgi:hypothetical protein
VCRHRYFLTGATVALAIPPKQVNMKAALIKLAGIVFKKSIITLSLSL